MEYENFFFPMLLYLIKYSRYSYKFNQFKHFTQKIVNLNVSIFLTLLRFLKQQICQNQCTDVRYFGMAKFTFLVSELISRKIFPSVKLIQQHYQIFFVVYLVHVCKQVFLCTLCVYTQDTHQSLQLEVRNKRKRYLGTSGLRTWRGKNPHRQHRQKNLINPNALGRSLRLGRL